MRREALLCDEITKQGFNNRAQFQFAGVNLVDRIV
ncbi:MAG: hypothetical protein H6Q30_875, partial [Bacteroidetes bacterium]|nr:hypothetical protein [Bacteroidota bacterium]